MKRNQLHGLLALCVFAALNLPAAVRYVDLNSASPTPPYTSWVTAAANIQDAVDDANFGDEILVTNGVYQVGTRVVIAYGMKNRVAVTKPITVRSVNGPLVTTIAGVGFLGPDAVRCVYLTNGAFLSGFTLTSGGTDAYRDTVGAGVLCESVSAVVSNCVLTGNFAYAAGGGACNGTLFNCTLTGNSVLNGGGGGAINAILNNCTLTSNYNVGALQCTLNNCTLTGNSGGGVYSGTLNNCALTGNSSSYYGGGASYAILNNCTLTGNSASWEGGGAYLSTLNNCIVYYNTAPIGANWSGGVFNYCSTTPLPSGGTGNRTEEPQLAGNWRLSAGSPCRGAGSVAYATGLDLDAELWANPPSIGCDEYWSGSLTGALSAAIVVSHTNVAVGFAVNFQAVIGGNVSDSRWDFGDGTVMSNRLNASHSWLAAGDYVVELRAYNETYPGGVAATALVHVAAQSVHYVALGNVSPVSPYNSWASAAASIQDAVDAATQVGALVMVSNGVYQAGARAVDGVSNRVAVTKPVMVRSANGPGATSILGYQPGAVNGLEGVRCAYLTNGAVLSGFTLTNGGTITSGGAVWCSSANAVVSNCVLTGNSADYQGGAAFGGTLKNCTLTGNSADYDGGGASGSVMEYCTLTGNTATQTGGGAYGAELNDCVLADNSAGFGAGVHSGSLNNCTLTGNSARYDGGGAHSSALNNCIVYYNFARVLGANYFGGALNYCCTTPMPSLGIGNIAAEPLLAGNWRLSTFSPCRGSGSAAYAGGLDLDGEPWASPPSIGCDEYYTGSLTGALNVAIVALYTNVAVEIAVDFQALIGGRVSASRWDFGDGTVISNRPYASHIWQAAGDYTVELRAYNESHPAGIAASVLVHVLTAPVHYVALNSPSPSAPYTSWVTAATNIQDAVDAAAAGGFVLVSNGVYQSGARAVYGMSNRVVVLKPLTLRSVNGPQFAVINGGSAVGCVYLADPANLSGFTLTNGAGGVTCESKAVVSNCVLTGNSGSGASGGILNNCSLTGNSGSGAANSTLNNCMLSGNFGRGASSSTLNNCVLTGNSGGGASSSTLTNCALTGNWADSGGGAANCVLDNCTLTANSASSIGGGALNGTLNKCTLKGNSAGYGGGAVSDNVSPCTLSNCVLTENSAQLGGGGAGGCTLNNCALTGNSGQYGGGARNGSLNNCTVTGNSAQYGGGVYNATLTNCIVYYNTARFSENNYSGSTLSYCCTTPMSFSGVGNLTAEPQLAGNWHLSMASPCRGAGSAGGSAGSDLDGEAWGNPPSIGCDEYSSGSGGLSVAILATYTNVAAGIKVSFQGLIEGRVSASRWDFGDGTVVSNRPYADHAWETTGEYVVELRAYNESHPAGVANNITVHVVVAPVHYVALNNSSPAAPYTSWATAAASIQDAVNAATPGGLVLVSNGLYQAGGMAVDGTSNRVAVTKPLTVRSVNGPGATSIVGSGTNNAAVRCVYLTNGVIFSGFTLTNGAAGTGGGLWCESASAMASNCVIAGNWAGSYGGAAYSGTLNNCALPGNSAQYGGGAYNATLNNCTLTGNSARGGFNLGGLGGGAYGGRLNNCSLAGNSAHYYGGGAYGGRLNNCIVYYNTAGLSEGNNYFSSTLNYCCTTPSSGGIGRIGNITRSPLFVNTNEWANLRLQPNSSCINSGLNAYAPGGTDLDGNPRVVGGAVDIGAYEFQSPASVISYAWLQQYGLRTDGSADYLDSDSDIMNNWQEWIAGTIPTDALSTLRLFNPSNNLSGITVTWQSVSNRTYFLERATDLGAAAPFSLLRSNILGQSGTTSYSDTNAFGTGPFFYRVGVQQ